MGDDENLLSNFSKMSKFLASLHIIHLSRATVLKGCLLKVPRKLSDEMGVSVTKVGSKT